MYRHNIMFSSNYFGPAYFGPAFFGSGGTAPIPTIITYVDPEQGTILN